jgi:hypothetical protein
MWGKLTTFLMKHNKQPLYMFIIMPLMANSFCHLDKLDFYKNNPDLPTLFLEMLSVYPTSYSYMLETT